VKALQIERSVPRFAAARLAGSLAPGKGAAVGPLKLVDAEAPEPLGPDWHHLRPRLAGICGSDLATIDGVAARYFEPIVSFPFVPGHEVVADTDDDQRVVIVPVLACAARGIDPPCESCAAGHINRCERVAFGHVDAGLQTGFCRDTGGGWGIHMIAHTSQIVPVAAALTDEEAVLVEPTACAVHAATRYTGEAVALVGAGTLGLLTLAALRAAKPDGGPIVVTAKYAEQRRLAKELGADVICEPAELPRVARSVTGSMAIGNQLTGGLKTVYDCVGSSESLAQSLRIVAPGGDVVLVGMPARVSLELTGLWHREVAIRGCYAYERADFDTAMTLVQHAHLGDLVSAAYPLAEYKRAIEHAANAGRRGGVKIAFDLRAEKERNR
jgi:threonine dehydrogenase-like Zn-dependent dehydrogenase